MDVEIKIVKGLEKPYAVIYTGSVNEEVQNMVSLMGSFNGVITANYNDRTIILKTVLLITSFAVGWVTVSLGIKGCVIAVGTELFIAFFLWLCFTLHYRKLVKRMNERIKNMKSENA